MPLCALEELATELVDNLPWVVLGHFVVSDRAEEVSWVGETVCTQGTEFWKFKVAAPDLENVTSGWSFDRDTESLAALDDTDLTRLDVELAELSLDVEVSFLGYDEEITIGVDESLLLHRLVGGENVGRYSFAKSGLTGTSDSREASNKVMWF